MAIVVDPLLSLAKSTPEIRAFRVYPAGYTPPKNQTPDGLVVSDVKVAIERWGACWDNYYSLEVSYFMSQLAQNTLNTFRDKFMWMNALTANSLGEPEKQKGLVDLISQATKETKGFAASQGGSGGIHQSFAQSSISRSSVGVGEDSESGGSVSRYAAPVTQVCLLYHLFTAEDMQYRKYDIFFSNYTKTLFIIIYRRVVSVLQCNTARLPLAILQRILHSEMVIFHHRPIMRKQILLMLLLIW